MNMIPDKPYSPDYVLSVLNKCIDMVAENISCYVTDPVADFTRKRKITPQILMKFIIQMGARSLGSEICSFFSNENAPGRSAVSMARSKLLPSAFLRVFHLFNRAFDCCRTYRGFHLIACDGTDVNIPYDPRDKGTSINGQTKSPYSQYHVHALYDCLNGIYRDIRITPRAEIGEVRSLEEMIRDRVYPTRSVIICDRGV